MATTQARYIGDGSTVLFSFPFPYIDDEDVKVTIDGVATTAFTIENTNVIRFNVAPANGTNILIFRETSTEDIAYVFYPGSSIKAKDLNQDFSQILYVAQELQDSYFNPEEGGTINGDVIFNGDVIINKEPEGETDGVNKLYVDTQDALGRDYSDAGDAALRDYIDSIPDSHAGPQAPSPDGVLDGDLWVNTTDGTMYVYFESAWVPISSSGGGGDGDNGGGLNSTSIESEAPIQHQYDGLNKKTTVSFRINSLTTLR